MGLKERLAAFKEQRGQQIENIKENRASEKIHRRAVSEAEQISRREAELDLAEKRGHEYAEKGSFFRQVGQKILTEAKKPPMPGMLTDRPRSPRQRGGGRRPKYIQGPRQPYMQPSFAPASSGRPVGAEPAKRPFINPNLEANYGNVSPMLEAAFFNGPGLNRGQRQPTAVERAFFGTPQHAPKGMSLTGPARKKKPLF